jgi:hypothetical protein
MKYVLASKLRSHNFLPAISIQCHSCNTNLNFVLKLVIFGASLSSHASFKFKLDFNSLSPAFNTPLKILI